MRIIFSRKGFDSTAGRAPSPIVAGRPVSLPIPARDRSATTYGNLGLGELVAQATRGRLNAGSLCHDDPMFADDHCWFGQCDAAQGHLRKCGVGPGDVFLFFGLFADPHSGERHHRIFGYMQIACCGHPDVVMGDPAWRDPARPHPHLSGAWPASNTIYFGKGATARAAAPQLRLTRPGGPLNLWEVPGWLGELGLTYHAKPERWLGQTALNSAKRGQEFVCNVGTASAPRQWLRAIIAEIEGDRLQL